MLSLSPETAKNPRKQDRFELFDGQFFTDHTRKVTGSSPVSPIEYKLRRILYLGYLPELGSAAQRWDAKRVYTPLAPVLGARTMPKLTDKTPSYRLHKASGQAIVQLDRQRFYLGRYGTPE